MSDRLRVKDRSIPIDVYELFEGMTLDDVRDNLERLHAQLEPELINQGHTTSFRTEYYGYDGGFDLYLDVFRDENDVEYGVRIARAEKAKQRKMQARLKKEEKARQTLMATEAQERAEFERLKAKFDPSSS
jgi:hypothetical protein